MSLSHLSTAGKCLASRWALAAVAASVMMAGTVVNGTVIEPQPESLSFTAVYGEEAPLMQEFVLAVPADVSATEYVLAIITDDPSPTILSASEAAWLTVADSEGEVSGTIATDESMTCTVTVNPAGLAVGEYSAVIGSGEAWGNVAISLVISEEPYGMHAFTGDLTRDGRTDLAALGTDGKVYLWSAAEGYSVLRQPVTLEVDGQPLSGMVAAGDIAGDGFPEIIIADQAGKLYVLWAAEGYANVRDTLLTVDGVPLLGDVDGNGHADLIVYNIDANICVRYSRENYLVSHEIEIGIAGEPVVGDFDGDGLADLLIVDEDGDGTVLLSTRDYQPMPVTLGLTGTALAGVFTASGRSDLLDLQEDGKVYTYLSPAYQRSETAHQLPLPEEADED